MNFWLNPLISVGCLTLSFTISRNFVNSELDKLMQKIDVKLDRVIVLISGIILALLIATGLTISTNFLYEYWHHVKINEAEIQLTIFFSILLASIYTIVSPNHVDLRSIDIENSDAKTVCNKFYRVAVVSLVIVALVDCAHHEKVSFCAIWIMVAYYFLEMLGFRKVLDKVQLTKIIEQDSLSNKLVNRVNQKIIFLLLLGMCVIAFRSDTSFTEKLKSIYWLLSITLIMQSLIAIIVDKLMERNLVQISDTLSIACYSSLIYFFLRSIGISLQNCIYHDKIIVVAGVMFVTVVIYRGFDEGIGMLLKKAENNEQEKIRLQTFLPTISIIFHLLLFVTSSLLILDHLSVNIAPILATFTVFSASVGLAAKDIIQSFLHGIILLIEKDLCVESYVGINGLTGIVTKLSARVLNLRDKDGSIHTISYNAINTITNYSQNPSYYDGELCIDTEENVEKVSKILIETVANMRKDQRFQNKILNDLKIHGLRPLDKNGPKIFWRIETVPESIAEIKYELYYRLYNELKKHGVKIPIANSIIAS
ncbi:MAG: mechanosensitive ion channel family protein [Holosporaceae bacterium]|nr:mechanosensitive ion channel family protein [Holosporaceae bacterium]